MFIRNYVAILYKKVKNEIESDIGNNEIWILADGTPDKYFWYIEYLIYKKMNIRPSHLHLITCKELEKVDHSSIARFIKAVLKSKGVTLWHMF